MLGLKKGPDSMKENSQTDLVDRANCFIQSNRKWTTRNMRTLHGVIVFISAVSLLTVLLLTVMTDGWSLLPSSFLATPPFSPPTPSNHPTTPPFSPPTPSNHHTTPPFSPPTPSLPQAATEPEESTHQTDEQTLTPNHSLPHPNKAVCWESPYVDCRESRSGESQHGEILKAYSINRSYTERFGDFHILKTDSNFDKSVTGLFSFRLSDTNKSSTTTRPTSTAATITSSTTTTATITTTTTTTATASTTTTFRGKDSGNNRRFRIGLLNKRSYVRQFHFSSCPFHNCDYVGDRIDESVDLVVVTGVGLRTGTLPKRWAHQIYALCGWESPAHFNSNLLSDQTPWTEFFNLTITYRRDADIFSPYAKLGFEPVPSETARSIPALVLQKKKTAVWIVSNCNTQSRRRQYVNEMQKYVDVDIFGACGKACPKTPDWCGRDMGQYHFYLAFENSLCADYVTEKFFKIFRKDFPVVPVVRGGADYDQLFPPRTFVNAASFKSAKELALHLKKLRGNAEEYGELLWEKLQYTKTKHDLNDFHCQLCEYLNSRDPLVRRFYDIRKWMGSCDIPKDIAG